MTGPAWLASAGRRTALTTPAMTGQACIEQIAEDRGTAAARANAWTQNWICLSRGSCLTGWGPQASSESEPKSVRPRAGDAA